MTGTESNQTLLMVGYGSLLSGHGLLGLRRGGKSVLRPRDAFPLMLTNARRGLAKPSSHGEYLAMDLEPIHRDSPITAKVGLSRSNGEIGALGLLFGREQAESMASREEYSPSRFLQLL